MLHAHPTVAVLSPNWDLVRDGVSPRIQFRCQQVATALQALLPDADIDTHHRFGGISKVYTSFGGRTAAVELQSSRGDVLYRALDGLGERLSAYEDPIDRLGFGGPVEEVASWLQRAS